MAFPVIKTKNRKEMKHDKIMDKDQRLRHNFQSIGPKSTIGFYKHKQF